MKRLACLFAVVALLAGCGVQKGELDRAMKTRARLLAASGCCFDGVVCADFGENTYTFEVNYRADGQGNMTFRVDAPETISGIAGQLSAEKGQLTFEDQLLAFPMLADGQVTPVSAGWLLIHTLRGGYVQACGMDGDRLRISMKDSYQENALQLEIWLGADDLPVYGEILYKDRRFLSIKVNNFRFL